MGHTQSRDRGIPILPISGVIVGAQRIFSAALFAIVKSSYLLFCRDPGFKEFGHVTQPWPSNGKCGGLCLWLAECVV